MLRRLLDGLYLGAGVLAAIFMVAILLVVLGSIVTRLLHVSFPGATDYAGYCMAASSFLALAYAFRRGTHIRVTLVIDGLSPGPRRLVEVLASGLGAGLAWYFAWYALRLVQFSRLLGDVSQGQDATPLWIPQLAMIAGTVLLAVALTDRLVGLIMGGDLRLGEDEGKEA